MRIIIAPQEFKGTLSGIAVAKAIKKGVLKVFPKASTLLIPVADGGDGTLHTLVNSKSGKIHYAQVTDSLGHPLRAPFGILKDRKTAVIELAQICGLAKLSPSKRNPLKTSTYGVGEIILAALDAGCRHFIIGIGGSATNDGGAGLAQALGIRLLDKKDKDLSKGGASLVDLYKIDMNGLDPRIRECTFIIGCDVSNPLIGKNGATIVYAPQKGAKPQKVILLEKGMIHFAKVVKKDLGIDIANIPRGGAAGGTGAGMFAFLGAQLLSGSEMVLDFLDFDKHLKGANLVITGEGCIDQQTVYEKAPIAVAKKAKSHKIPVLAVVGRVGPGYHEVHKHGIDAVVPLTWCIAHCKSENYEQLIMQALEESLRLFKL